MSLRARLTLWSVLVMAIVVGVISTVDLGHEMQQQFDATLQRADLLKQVAGKLVSVSLGNQPTAPLREALRAPILKDELIDLLSASHAVLEIAVCNRDDEILADSDPTRVGMRFGHYDDFRPLVRDSSWLDKLRVLTSANKYYQLDQPLVAEGENTPVLYVRVLVYPALIRSEVTPTLSKNARIDVISILVAMIVTLLFSSIAFRPLGRLGKMLDLVASGEYNPEPLPAPRKAGDELGVMASKVSLLGEQLRGARYDFSDLRGNFERLLDELEDAVLIFSRERRLVIASGAVEKFLGRQRSDLLGQPLNEIFPPTTTLGLILAQASQTGRPIRNRRVPITRNSDAGVFVALLSVDILDSLSPGPNPGRGTGLLVRMRDPEATRQIGRQLQTADRLSAISRITGGVAHEVKNPLNAILMHVELARMKMSRGDHDLAPQMEIISREILRLDRVVKTFLDFTRPVELKLNEVPLDGFVNDIVELARPQAAANGIQIHVDQETEGASIRVDLDLMKQAILNVVVNAIEAMPKGGELRFASAIRDEDAEIRISDTGPGISPELRDKIFRLYFTTKKEGSGIGLAMTFRIVQLHDGTIDFSSEPGKGTTFIVRLPTAV